MQKIAHRINTLSQLQAIPQDYGIEVDVRYHKNDLILHHDPFGHHENAAEKLEALLKAWRHQGPLILNIKTEGIERKCITLMQKYSIQNWFFLDLSMPYCAAYAQKAINAEIKGFSSKNLAVRYSEYEALDYCLGFSGKATWVWVDCFTTLPLDHNIAAKLKAAGFKLCLVSPELQGHSLDRIGEFKALLNTENISLDAVCTKRPDLW